MAKQLSGKEKFFTYVVPKFVGIGASVVIIGALFKLMHWPNAGTMLIIGLGTEAAIFFLYAFAPIEEPHDAPDWETITKGIAGGVSNKPALDASTAAKLAAIEASIANSITPEKVEGLGTGMKQLAENVSKMGNLANASVATEEYAKNVKLASTSLTEMNKSYASTVNSMQAMANASEDTKKYHAQVQNLTKTLSTLNASYEMELQDSKKYAQALTKYYGGLATAMENVVNASKDTETFKTQMSGLTTNITSLNKVYGAMLTAMKGAQ
jgi:gliding motility-associated protein GldL